MLTRLIRTPGQKALVPAWRAVGRRSVLGVRNGLGGQRRTIVAAPTPGGGPLMERRGDRELPDVQPPLRRWLRTLPIFFLIIAACTLTIFNYQKSSSSVVAATLYALRTNPKAREYLGDEIYFASQMPWIWGEMNQLHGRIDIRFDVKGTKNRGTMRFRSERKTRQGVWETVEWSLEKNGKGEDGAGRLDLLEGGDGFRTIEFDPEVQTVPGRGLYSPSREV